MASGSPGRPSSASAGDATNNSTNPISTAGIRECDTWCTLRIRDVTKNCTTVVFRDELISPRMLHQTHDFEHDENDDEGNKNAEEDQCIYIHKCNDQPHGKAHV